MSIRYRFYTIGWSGISICSFAAAKVLLFFEICKYLGGRNVRKNGFLAKSSDNIRPNGRKKRSFVPCQRRNTNRASMHDAGTRETAGIKCRGKEERNYFVFHKKQKNGNKKVGTNKRTHERMA